MRYHVTHTSTYSYSDAVTLCHNEAYLSPRDTAQQRCFNHTLQITPAPIRLDQRIDFFGNTAHYFALQTAHQQLSVSAQSDVATQPAPQLPAAEAWETVRAQIGHDSSRAGIAARGLALTSAFIGLDKAAVEYAHVSFVPGRPLLDAVSDLSTRIYSEFSYDPHFTTLVTPLSEVIEHRRGVCQDFAHLAIACVRAMGLPARYVSGYLETMPAPGQEKLQGADASHAWFSVYLPGHGWFDFDPTNNQRPNEQYVTTAWGRDYGDVTPLKGVIIGGGEHQLEVAVDVIRQD